MADATRLTRAGRLAEATALIQRLLARGPAASSTATVAPTADDWSGPTLDLSPEPAPPPEPAAAARHEAPRATAARRHARRPAPAGRRRGTDRDLPGRWLDGAYANPFGRRPYKLYVPAARPSRGMPLLVMLHGCTQSPDDFARGTGMNRLAEAAGLLVVYPGQVQSANPQRCWNWFQPTDQEREQGEPSLIAGITREVVHRHAADPAQVYVAGLSAGGAKAAVMAAAYPDLYAALGVHSGLAHRSAHDVPSALAAMRGAAAGRAPGRFVPTIVVHGEHDRTVHPGNADSVLAQALAVAPPLTASVEDGQVPGGHTYRRTRHRTADGVALVEDWRVQGLGHAWSGGDPAGSHTDPRGPDASRAILDFCLAHRLGGTA